jgi:hypothetical protein
MGVGAPAHDRDEYVALEGVTTYGGRWGTILPWGLLAVLNDGKAVRRCGSKAVWQ